MSETIEDSIGTRQRQVQRRRSRVYGTAAGGTASSAVPSEQGDYMRADPYLAPERSRDELATGSSAGSQVAQRGQHGEGAETTGNSARGALSGGLSGATTTRGGQQGGIGASIYDPEPTVVDTEERSDPGDGNERDLTLGEQYGGVMEPPGA